MAIPTTTLIELIRSIADSLNAYEHGTATGGSASTLIANTYPFATSRANASTKAYEACEIRVTDATNPAVVECMEIVNYAPSTGTFTLSPNPSFTPEAGDTFDIFKRGITYQDIKDAINRALRKRGYLTYVELTDGKEGTTTFDVPDSINDINNILGVRYQLDSDAGELSYRDVPWYEIVPQGGDDANLYQIVIIPQPKYPVYLLTLIPFSELDDDTDTINVDRSWIETAALVELLDKLRKLPYGNESKQYNDLFKEYSRRLQRLDWQFQPRPRVVTGFKHVPIVPRWTV